MNYSMKDLDMENYFAKYDSDKDGFLSASELKELLREMDNFLILEEVEDLILRFDLNDDKSLSRSEYMDLMHSIQKEINTRMDQRLQVQFKIFDTNGDGFISAEEMYKVLVKTYPSMSIEAAELLIKDADLDKDNRVSLDEFRKLDLL